MLIFKRSVCEAGAESDSLILTEEERLELDVEEMVVDPGLETGAGAMQSGVCGTSGASTPMICLQDHSKVGINQWTF